MTPVDELRAEVICVFNGIGEACAGHSSVAVYMALSMTLGMMAASARKPDFDEMIELVSDTARAEFELRTSVRQ